MADVGLPLAAIRDQVADAIDLVVRQERAPDGTRRIVEVAEVVRVAGGPGGARAVHDPRRPPVLARAAGRHARGPPRRRGRRRASVHSSRLVAVNHAAWLAAGAAGAGVVGAWEALAAVERTRVAAAAARVLEPLARAGREGRVPTAPERRRLWAVAAAALLAAGWLAGGVGLGVLAALAGPAAVVAAVRARRRRWREELRRSAPALRAHDGRRARRRPLDPHGDRRRGRERRGRRRARAADRRARARARRADRDGARPAAAARPLARLEHAHRGGPAPARRGRRPGRAAAGAGGVRRGRRPRRARRARGDRAGALHRLARARPPRARPPSWRSSRRRASPPRCWATRSRPGSRRWPRSCSSRRSRASAGSRRPGHDPRAGARRARRRPLRRGARRARRPSGGPGGVGGGGTRRRAAPVPSPAASERDGDPPAVSPGGSTRQGWARAWGR